VALLAFGEPRWHGVCGGGGFGSGFGCSGFGFCGGGSSPLGPFRLLRLLLRLLRLLGLRGPFRRAHDHPAVPTRRHDTTTAHVHHRPRAPPPTCTLNPRCLENKQKCFWREKTLGSLSFKRRAGQTCPLACCAFPTILRQ
jgi:hypothetical protein